MPDCLAVSQASVCKWAEAVQVHLWTKDQIFVWAWWWTTPFLVHKGSRCTGVVSCRWRVETGLHGVKLHVPCLHWTLCRKVGRELAEKLSQCRNISELNISSSPSEEGDIQGEAAEKDWGRAGQSEKNISASFHTSWQSVSSGLHLKNTLFEIFLYTY